MASVRRPSIGIALCALLAAGASSAQAQPDSLLSPDTLDLRAWAQGANAMCAGTKPEGPTNYWWSGRCVDGVMEGSGTLEVESGGTTTTIIGGFVHGVAEGREQISQGNALFDGEFHQNWPNGDGIWFDGRGTRTQGRFRTGGYDGPVTAFSPDGSRRDVSYFIGSVDGPSVRTLADGTRIEIAYKSGQAVGRSVTTFPDGGTLTTHYANNVVFGRAVYRDAGGRRYEGAFVPAQTIPADQDMPPMPVLSRKLHEEGVAELSYVVTPDGRVSQLGLHRSSRFQRLDRACFEAVAQWRYQPAMVGDHPVPSFIVAAFVFTKKDWIANGPGY